MLCTKKYMALIFTNILRKNIYFRRCLEYQIDEYDRNVWYKWHKDVDIKLNKLK